MKQTPQPDFSAVAITGIGCMFPKAPDKGAFWANIRNGRDCIVEIPATHWRIDDYYHPDPDRPDHTHARTGGFLDPVAFDPMEFGISPNSLEAIDTSQLLTLLATRQALIDAGYDNGKPLDRDRVSVILGVTGAQQLVVPLGARLYHPVFRRTLLEAGLTEAEAEEIVKRINHQFVGWQEASFPGLLGNVVAGRIANRFDFGGSNCVVDAACAGSLASVHMACMELQTRRSDMVITGGVDTFNDIFMYMCFTKTKAMSATGSARPFDQSADGTTIGEGVGVITLKRLEDAERDGDTIYAVIRGIGTSSDGKGNAIYAPAAKGQKKALERAYATAGITPDTIELVEAHGTGTPVGDAIEVDALSDVFRAAGAVNRSCAIGSVKSQIGHGKAAAGVAGLIKTALALHHRTIPPTIKVTTPQPALAGNDTPFYLTTEQRPWASPAGHPRRAAVSSFGFGGSNFHCVLEEHSKTSHTPDWDIESQIVAVSAPDAATLADHLSHLPVPDSLDALRILSATTRKTFDAGQNCRLVMAINDFQHTGAMIATARDMLKNQPDTRWETPDGIFFGCGAIPGKIAAVFPGQGTQYPGMLRDMACRFPEFLAVLDQADTCFREHSDKRDPTRLSDVIYPPTAFSEPEKNAQIERLKLTRFAQPGIGATSIGAWQVLHDRFDLAVDAAAGHSYGEICAMCASEMISMEEFHSLSSLRGRLMSAGDTDRGGMAAVQAPLDQISTIIAEENLDLVIANKNAPNQAVISGKSESISRAVDVFRKHKITITPLKVSAAFHSPLVADASKPFGEHLENINFEKGAFPVYSNTLGDRYPAQQKKIRDILASQLENPVEFVEEIKQMINDGIRTFIEIGPGKRMTGLIGAITEDSGIHRIALDVSNGKRTGLIDLARTLATLSALGYPVNLQAWDGGTALSERKPVSRSRVEVMLTGSNYIRDKQPLPPFTIRRDQPRQVPEAVSPSQAAAPGALPARHAFDAIQENLAGLQRLQEQTAQLHQQFLTSQIEAQQAFQSLILQQQGVAAGKPVMPPMTPIAPPAIPAVKPAPAPIARAVPVPVPAAVPAATSGILAPAPIDSPAVTRLVMDIVAAKTGYPADMLEPGMELDADLGIDSIKRVEIMSALQEKVPDLPPVSPEKMSTIRSLNDVAALVSAAAGSAVPRVAPVTVSVPSSAARVHAVQSARSFADSTPDSALTADADLLLAVIAEKTGYPVDLLELGMELDSDLGIDSIKRVEIMSALQERKPGMTAVNPERMARIRTLRDICEAMQPAPESPRAERFESTRISPFDTKPIRVQREAESAASLVIVREIIAAKTGYPTDLLEPQMELDSDLGIDSIKRVEIMSAIQEKTPNLPAIKPDQLVNLRTIQDISDLVAALGGTREKKPGLETLTPGEQGPGMKDAETVEPGTPHVPVHKTVTTPQAPGRSEVGAKPAQPETAPAETERSPEPAVIEREATRQAPDTKAGGAEKSAPAKPVAPPKGAEEKTGVHRAAGKGIAAKPVTGRIKTKTGARGATGVLTRKPETLFRLDRKVLGIEPFDAAARNRITVPEHAEIWITRDDCGLSELIHEEFENRYIPVRLVSPDYLEFVELPDEVAGLIIVGPRDTCGMEYVNKVFELIKLVSKKIRRPGSDTGHHPIVVSIVRLDGAFGLGSQLVDYQPMTASLSGLLKTIQLEWPETRCRVIDIAADRDFQPDIPDLIEELFLDGPFEMGWSARGKVKLTLNEMPQDPERMTGEPLVAGDWIMATGGARGVTAACVLEIAKRFRTNVVLAGRSEPPKPEPEWLSAADTEADVKKAILAESGTKLTPKELAALYSRHMNNREMLRHIESLKNLGVNVMYESIDMTDADAVRRLFEKLKQDGIRIRGLIHGAGIIADKLIEEKPAEDFDRVIRTKVESLRYLSEHLELDALKTLVLFSSSTARFGRIGQVDYAMANEVLNKFAAKFSRLYPACRTLAFNWGPWNGGMVTPELKKVFQKEGIGVIDIASGARFLTRELRLEYGVTLGAPVEIVAIGTEIADSELPGDTHEPPGLAAAAESSRRSKQAPEESSGKPESIIAEQVITDPEEALPRAAEHEKIVPSPESAESDESGSLIEVFRMPLSTKLLPVLKSHLMHGMPVVPMSLLMEWAAYGALKQHPALIFHSLENFRLLKGIVLRSDEPLELECKVGQSIRENRLFRVPLELRGIQPDGQKFVHVSTDVILVPRLPDPPDSPPPLDNPEPYPIHQAQLYHDVLFHGEELQSIRSVEGINESGITAAVDSAPPPAQWMRSPLDTAWVTDPMAVDAAFQLMILWTDLMLDMPSLPCGLKSYRQFTRDMPAWCIVEVRVKDHHGAQVFADICFKDNDGKTVAVIESYECITDRALREAFQNKPNE